MAVIITFPSILFFVIIFPDESISINDGLLLVHVTFLFVALLGDTVAVSFIF